MTVFKHYMKTNSTYFLFSYILAFLESELQIKYFISTRVSTKIVFLKIIIYTHTHFDLHFNLPLGAQ